jgi:hypothetical protein
MHAPESVRASVLVVRGRPGGRLAVRTPLDIAAHGDDEPLGGCGDLGNGGLERIGISRGWLPEPADLAHVLARGRLDLAGRGGIVLMAECSNASAHAGSVPAVPEGIARA